MRLYLFLILFLSSGKFSGNIIGDLNILGQDIFQIFIPLIHLSFFLVYNRKLDIKINLSDKTISITVALVLLALISTLWSVTPFKTLLKSIFIIVSLFSFIQIISNKDFVKIYSAIANSLFIISILNIVVCVYFPKIGIATLHHPTAWNGIYVQKNHLGRFASFAILFNLIGLINKSLFSFRQNFIHLTNILLFTILLIFSESKTGQNITLVLVLFILIVKISGLRKLIANIVNIGFILIVISITISIYVNFSTISKINVDYEDSLTGRIPIWIASIDLFIDKWFIGYGFGGFWQGYDYPSKYVYDNISWEPNDSHNGFIDIILDLGLLGFVFLIILFSRILKYKISIFKNYSIYLSNKIIFEFSLIMIYFIILYNITESSMLRMSNFIWYIMLLIIVIKPKLNYNVKKDY